MVLNHSDDMLGVPQCLSQGPVPSCQKADKIQGTISPDMSIRD